LVREHLDRGDLCAIVTATNEFVTAPIARAFGIPHLIATVPAMHEGRYTGRIQGVPSFQAGTVTRGQQWPDEMGRTLAALASAFSDSVSATDRPLLQVVAHPVATIHSAVELEVGAQRNWELLGLVNVTQDAKCYITYMAKETIKNCVGRLFAAPRRGRER